MSALVSRSNDRAVFVNRGDHPVSLMKEENDLEGIWPDSDIGVAGHPYIGWPI